MPRLRRGLGVPVLLALSGCIGDLPRTEYPCLIAEDRYNKYNETYVFSPRGDKKRQALAAARDAEQQCELSRASEGVP